MKAPDSVRNHQILTRRSTMAILLTALLAPLGILKASNSRPKQQKIAWIRLKDEPVGPGDFWASYDPNTPERQGEQLFNLQLQATHPLNYGVPADKIGRGCGDYWRPIGLVMLDL
ncbi:MAG: hypothetical protein Q7R72_01495 [bacterium]|nr:hypothetical protein [bacterium]